MINNQTNNNLTKNNVYIMFINIYFGLVRNECLNNQKLVTREQVCKIGLIEYCQAT